MAHRLTQDEWRPLETAHHARVDAVTAAHLSRRQGARKHPVEDFLSSYYMHSPAQLRRWHPGPGILLEGAVERAEWVFYRYADGAASLDLEAFQAARTARTRLVRELLSATAARPAHLGCRPARVGDGLPPETRAAPPDRLAAVPGSGGHRRGGRVPPDPVLPLRRCPVLQEPARTLNTLSPTRDSQVAIEQPDCLHATMDLYKWVYKLSPAIPSDLTADCFDLAREVRELDMRAAPYDLRALGYEPVKIETPAGKATYVDAQRDFAARGHVLRLRLIDACDTLLTSARAG